MIDVALVGLGWWGRHLQALLRDETLGLRVAATVDRDRSTGAGAADLEEVVDRHDISAVILCTPHSTHFEQILRCAAAGKHVFCEKPLTLDATQAELAVAACRSSRVVLGIGHERRFEPAMREVRRMVQQGELGTILHAEAAFSHDKFVTLESDSWRGSASDAPAAGMTGMGVHLTDAFISMFGPISQVHALVARRVLALDSGDVVSVNLRFDSGATGALSAVSATPFYARYAVFGSDAWVETREKQHPEAGTASLLTVCRRGGDPPSTTTFDVTDAVSANLRCFAAAVEGSAAYPFTDAELVHNVAVLQAVVESAGTGQSVHLSR